MRDEGPTKICRQCKKLKPPAEFYRHPSAAGGYRYECKSCKRTYQAAYYHGKTKDAEWIAKERQVARRRMRKRRSEDPGLKQYQRALRVTRTAVKNGRVVRSLTCERCGHDFSKYRREAHHRDYSRPLEVEWLCGLCHGREHRKSA